MSIRSDRRNVISCGQCSFIIQGRRTSNRDSLIRQRRAEFLSKIAEERGMRVDDEKLLESYGGRDFSARGTPSPVVDLIRRAKDRKDNANRAGFWNVLHRFKTYNSYAAIMTATGRNEDDVAEIDLMAVLHPLAEHISRDRQVQDHLLE